MSGNTCFKLFAVTFWRLAGSSRYHYWTRLNHPICVYGKNAKQAIINAIKTIERFPVIVTPGYHEVLYVFNPKEFDLSVKGLKFYIFWIIGQGHHCIVPAFSKKAAKQYLRQKGVLVYDGRAITAVLLKICSKDKCPGEHFCRRRQDFSRTLCSSKPADTTIDIVTPITEKPLPRCPLCCEQLNDLNFCNSCGWDKNYGSKSSPHVDRLVVS